MKTIDTSDFDSLHAQASFPERIANGHTVKLPSLKPLTTVLDALNEVDFLTNVFSDQKKIMSVTVENIAVFATRIFCENVAWKLHVRLFVVSAYGSH
jgi:hypothetical protein